MAPAAATGGARILCCMRNLVLPLPAISTVSYIFGAALLALSVLSILTGRELDARMFQHHWGPPPTWLIDDRSMLNFPSEDTTVPEIKAVMVDTAAPENLVDTAVEETVVTELQKSLQILLQKVPAEWNTSLQHVWSVENAEFYYGCSEPTANFAMGPNADSNGYLVIDASGGLNQQRTGITDAVVVAKLLNATLVVPRLDHTSYWKDSSNFSDIFDINWFIKSVASDINVMKEPSPILEPLAEQLRHGLRVPRKANATYYLNKILPLLKKKHALRLSKFDYRLSNRLDLDWQRLRCRTNYKALRFTKNIQDMGQKLVDRIRVKSRHFIALHLRYELDMLAFSGCYYGGGEKEVIELGRIRKRWKTLHNHNAEKARRNGKCPLTPKEVGLMLRALGYGEDSYLYVASGEVYNGDVSLAPLKALFPNFLTKDTLATKEELEPFMEFSSRMAALDYIVCSKSNVFVTNNNGNMARILAGERRFNGHRRTIRPNVKKLNNLFPLFDTMPWENFAAQVQEIQKRFMGDPMEVPPGQGQFHENPLQCICEKPEAKEMLGKLRSHVGGGNMVSNIEEAKLSGLEFFKGHTEILEDEEEEEDDLPMIIEEYQSKAGEGDFILEKDKDTDLANNEGNSGT
ncbi:hypothetical protein CY35_15G003300 [Sphagnum magellanicum]|nr:hypothetical protein CY35_15G003300 [Sphagnum magellanicum]